MAALNLQKKTQDLLDNFTAALKDVFGDGLISVTLYGSVSSGEYSKKNSNINTVVILRDAGIRSLRKAQGLVSKSKFSAINPLFFTEDYIRRSTDVFPIEFLDMKENHAVLYGKDVLAGIEIDTKNLRFQCEQELKSKLINIKRAYLKNNDRVFFEKILFKFFTSCLHILRNIIRLKTGRVVYSKEEIIKDAAREFRISEDVLMRIWDAKRTGARLGHKAAEELFFLLVENLEKLSDTIDTL